jgi:hypothetical protein
MRTSKRVRLFTPTGVREYPVLSNSECEGHYITIASVRYHEGIPCYPLIIGCEEGLKYTILENLDKINIIPRYSVEGIERGAVIVKRIDGVLFKVTDPVLSYILIYLKDKPSVSFREILENLIVTESTVASTEYTEDLVETLTIVSSIALGFLAQEAELIEVKII